MSNCMVNLEHRFVVENDDIFPVVYMCDKYGEETDDPDEAVTCVAGRDGYWLTITIGKQDRVH